LKQLVLDASVVLSWCFEDESTTESERALSELSDGTQGLCPSIWSLEIANALLVAERRKRITQAYATQFLSSLSRMNIEIRSSDSSKAWTAVLNLAREHQLSTYDASYLELAMSAGAPLATLDKRLREAAHTVGLKSAP
jgi:predicted nucleic acid-binding protein